MFLNYNWFGFSAYREKKQLGVYKLGINDFYTKVFSLFFMLCRLIGKDKFCDLISIPGLVGNTVLDNIITILPQLIQHSQWNEMSEFVDFIFSSDLMSSVSLDFYLQQRLFQLYCSSSELAKFFDLRIDLKYYSK